MVDFGDHAGTLPGDCASHAAYQGEHGIKISVFRNNSVFFLCLLPDSNVHIHRSVAIERKQIKYQNPELDFRTRNPELNELNIKILDSILEPGIIKYIKSVIRKLTL